MISATDQLLSADQYSPLIVGYNNGAAVRLSDVAEVIDSVEDVRNAGMVDGILLGQIIIFRQPGANIIDTWTASRRCRSCRPRSRRRSRSA